MEMRYCSEKGIPHEKYLKEWTDEDRAKNMAQIIHESQICSMCGTAAWEWDPEQGGSRYAYEPVEEICPGCEKKDWLRDDKDKKKAAGGFITLRKRDV